MYDDFSELSKKALKMAGQIGERRRQFKSQAASNLSRSRMAEIERQQTGATKRAEMAEAGANLRASGEEAGLMARLGKTQQFSRQSGQEGVAAQRLSWAKEQATKEQGAKDFNIRAGGILGKYIKRDAEGNEMLDSRLQPALKKARALAIENPEEGTNYLSKAVKFLEAQGKGTGAGKDIGEQVSAESIGKQPPVFSMEDISLMETAGFIAPEKAQELKKEQLFQQRLAAFMPKEAIAPQTRGTGYYDLSHGRSQRLGGMR